ncbi:alpha-2Da adrenergic receptor [Contarinia nasturtii]|uniref:alpha-2Da adrenergic receptor n=1 Tax=Contarinia nasturtii TaxID=265458 RepID=UPI0012D37694|nr:alpha-2Da adrenergic receptor [Contarinia nasturtii]
MAFISDNTTEEFLATVGNSSFNRHLTSTNETNPNTTIIHDLGYPSGYSLTHIVFASVVVTLLMIIIVVGNMLVIIAIITEKSLKNIQNWFIASLAVADFFLGLVIMPFSLANELMGYWIFGPWWCDIHSAMDVLLSTASIMNLCLISLDRYWSITKAVEYLKTRTPARALVMIAAVWIMSALICIPPLLGWGVKRSEESLPQCELSDDLGYVLYSALGSFYIPSCIMVFVYIRIYFAAKARARRGIKKKPLKSTQEQVTSFTTKTNPMPCLPSTSQDNNHHQQQIATIETRAESIPIPIVTCDFASDVSTSEAAEMENQNYEKDTLKVCSTNLQISTSTGTVGQASAINATNNKTNGSSSPSNELKVSPTFNRCRALSVGIDNDMVSEFDPSSSDSGVISRCAVVKPLKFRLCQPIFGKRNHHKSNTENAKVQHKHNMVESTELEPAIPKIQKQRDPEKEKRRIARKKEKRATLILGLIMGSFIACWLPFFAMYILTPMCTQCDIPESAFDIAFWLGYMNSALNPAIYTIFNKDFRRAFRRILFK